MRGDYCGMQAWFSANIVSWFCGGLFVYPCLAFIFSLRSKWRWLLYTRSRIFSQCQTQIRRICMRISPTKNLSYCFARIFSLRDSMANMFVCMLLLKEASIRSAKAEKNQTTIYWKTKNRENDNAKKRKVKRQNSKAKGCSVEPHQLWLHVASFRFFVFFEFLLFAFSCFRFQFSVSLRIHSSLFCFEC